jgi:hypothetical protein
VLSALAGGGDWARRFVYASSATVEGADSTGVSVDGYSEGVALLSVSEPVLVGERTAMAGRGPLSVAGVRSAASDLGVGACLAAVGEPVKTCLIVFQKLRLDFNVLGVVTEAVRAAAEGRGDAAAGCSRTTTGVEGVCS